MKIGSKDSVPTEALGRADLDRALPGRAPVAFFPVPSVLALRGLGIRVLPGHVLPARVGPPHRGRDDLVLLHVSVVRRSRPYMSLVGR